MLTIERYQFLRDAVARHFPLATSSDRVIEPQTGLTAGDLHGLVDTIAELISERETYPDAVQVQPADEPEAPSTDTPPPEQPDGAAPDADSGSGAVAGGGENASLPDGYSARLTALGSPASSYGNSSYGSRAG